MSPTTGPTPTTVNLASVDAMFAKVLTKLEQMDSVSRETRDLMKNLTERVNTLERAGETLRAKIAGGVIAISCVVGVLGWLVQTGIGLLFS